MNGVAIVNGSRVEEAYGYGHKSVLWWCGCFTEMEWDWQKEENTHHCISAPACASTLAHGRDRDRSSAKKMSGKSDLGLLRQPPGIFINWCGSS